MTGMICDNCRLDEYKKLAIHSNVKSSVLYIVKCWTCGYETVKKLNTKMKGETYAKAVR
jgi:hypothetical protein